MHEAEDMGFKTRLQNGLLLAIIILLALNLLLPVRYTFKLVRLEPVSDGPVGELDWTAEPAANKNSGGANVERRRGQAPWQHRREPALEKRDPVNMEERRRQASPHQNGPPKEPPLALNNEKRWRDREAEVNVNHPLPHKVNYDKMEEKEPPPDLFHTKHDTLYEQEEEKKSLRVNFHDPSQRMAYYKKLRKKLVGRGPNMRALQEQRSKFRMELVREMWDDWFEGDDQNSSKCVLECDNILLS